MPILRIHAPVLGREERVLEWDGRETLLLGRDEGCDVVLLEAAASRHHARLERHDDQIVLVDCGSANGSWVGDERVWGQRVLHDGEVVRIGDTTLQLVMDPHRQPTLLREVPVRKAPSGGAATVLHTDAKPEPDAPVARDDIGSGPTLAAPGPPPAPPPAHPPQAEPVPLPARASEVVRTLGVQPTLPQRVGPVDLGPPDRSAPSVYSLGSEPTLARDALPRDEPDRFVPDASAPSVYSLGDEPSAPSRAPDRFVPDASAPSVYSLGNEPSAPSHAPDRFVPDASAPSIYSLGNEPSAASHEPDRFDFPASSPSIYSLGDEPAQGPRGPDVPALGGPVSSAQLGAAPPRPGTLPGAAPLGAPPPPAPIPPPHHATAGSSWEWTDEAPPPRHPRHRAAGPTLWLGVGLFVGGIIAMIVALAAGYAPSDLATLFGLGTLPGGLR